MSDLSDCNYCKLHSMKRRAKAEGRVIIISQNGRIWGTRGIPGFPSAVSVHEVATRREKPAKENQIAWFAELTSSCCC